LPPIAQWHATGAWANEGLVRALVLAPLCTTANCGFTGHALRSHVALGAALGLRAAFQQASTKLARFTSLLLPRPFEAFSVLRSAVQFLTIHGPSIISISNFGFIVFRK